MSTTSSASQGTPKRAEPESFRARGLSVSLTVKDLEKSLAWYCDVVGFTLDRKDERDGQAYAASLKAGGARLRLNKDDGAKGWDRVKGVGISLFFTTAQDIDAMAKGIEQAGGSLAMQPKDMPWGARMFKLVDPDGFMLSIASIPAE
jgi:lactoylglutathione lyase